MWRLEADLFFGEQEIPVTKRVRYNPYEKENDVDFFSNYRLTKPVFKQLLDILRPSLARGTMRNDAIEPSLQLCTALRYFAEGGHLHVIGDLHGLSRRTASNCIHSVTQAVSDRLEHFIMAPWPDSDEQQHIEAEFLQHEDWPSVAGLVFSTHVPLCTPHRPVHEKEFVNSRGFHSINTQVICDRNLKILNIDAHFPGSCHDAYILRNTNVWERFESSAGNNESVLLGHSGYPLKQWLMTPYTKPATEAQHWYNSRHKQVYSSIVQRCNSVLKSRWRCLTLPITFQPARASRVIVTCCALHNFALTHGLELPEDSGSGGSFNETLTFDKLCKDSVDNSTAENVIVENLAEVTRNRLVEMFRQDCTHDSSIS